MPTIVPMVIYACPQFPGGEIATTSFGEITEKLNARVDPKKTATTSMKFEPVIVTDVPPKSDPTFGETPVTEGGFLKVNTSEEEVAEVPASLVTVISVFPAE